jgi:hypothetical protein
MKVSDLRKLLDDLNGDDDICALVYDKSMFDYEEDDEVELTKEGWYNVVADFDETPFNDVYESIMMAVVDHAVDRV